LRKDLKIKKTNGLATDQYGLFLNSFKLDISSCWNHEALTWVFRGNYGFKKPILF